MTLQNCIAVLPKLRFTAIWRIRVGISNLEQVFPGWYVERKAKNISVWVLNEKHFLSYLNKEAVKLTESEIVVLAKGIGRYVQNQSQH